MERIERIVLHIPHASPVLPFGRSDWGEGIEKEISRWTDWYTDWLFASASRLDPRIIPVSYPFSRFFCDVERLENDPLEAVGQGRVYQRFGSLERIVPEDELEFALRSYGEHRERLVKALSACGTGALLVDCHSFPEDLSDVDVCIGVNDDWSKPEDALIQRAIGHFTLRGYSTTVNSPYSNAITPECAFKYQSLMIEVNKSTYLEAENQLSAYKSVIIRKTIEELFYSLLIL